MSGGSMAKSKEQFKARNLRKNGISIREIAKKLKVSRGSVSLWCRDIELTKKQKNKLHEQMIRGGYEGRLLGSKIQKERKIRKIEEYLLKGEGEIGSLKNKELLIAGICLYWGEGAKNCSGVRFYNSNPLVIKFIMKWFRECLDIDDSRFLMYININQIHKKRLNEVIDFWSKLTDISIHQFRGPFLIKTKSKKVYENFSEHYGTLSIRIAKSSELLYQILGWIKALSEAG
jgi:AcrR family transcriptional regulator